MEKRKLFKDNGKLKLLIIVGTRPEIIRLSAVIKKCRKYFDTVLAHTGQNYDYNLNGVFFRDLELDDPEVYLNAVGNDLGETMGNIISESYKLMAEIKPDAVLVLGDTNSCLSVIGAKRLHIPIFHMEAGNRCKDECLPKRLEVAIPAKVSEDLRMWSEYVYENHAVEKVTVDSSIRKIGVNIDYGKLENTGDLTVIDVPLTLSAAYRSVELALGVDYIGIEEIMELAKEKELNNFIKTVNNLILEDIYTRKSVSVRKVYKDKL